jgi:hypothetical protein
MLTTIISALPCALTIIGWALYATMMWNKLGGDRNRWIAMWVVLLGLVGYTIQDCGSAPLWRFIIGVIVALGWGAITGFETYERFRVKDV